VVVISELFGRASFAFSENAVKVGEIVESATEANFANRLRRINQKANGIANTNI
jgi:hypothetical protein